MSLNTPLSKKSRAHGVNDCNLSDNLKQKHKTLFLVFSNFDFQFLTMTSRGGQYFYRFSSACRLIEYNSSIIHKFLALSISVIWKFLIFIKRWITYEFLKYSRTYKKYRNIELSAKYFSLRRDKHMIFYLLVQQFFLLVLQPKLQTELVGFTNHYFQCTFLVLWWKNFILLLCGLSTDFEFKI